MHGGPFMLKCTATISHQLHYGKFYVAITMYFCTKKIIQLSLINRDAFVQYAMTDPLKHAPPACALMPTSVVLLGQTVWTLVAVM